MSAMLHVVVPFLLVLSFYYHGYDSTPPVTVVSCDTSSLLPTVTMAPSLMGLQAKSDQHDVVLPSPMTPRQSLSVVGLATVLQHQPPSQMLLEAYAKYATGPAQVGFSF